MGKTIEIRLSDAQHAALTEAAQNSGINSFFAFCRDKLMEGLTLPVYGAAPSVRALPGIRADNERVGAELRDVNDRLNRAFMADASQPAPADDRIARIEDAVARLTNYVMAQAEPAADQPQPTEDPIDVDSIVNAQFRDAEAQGLTEHVPDENEEVMRHAGVRPLSRRPMRYSANSAPRHLQQL